MTLETGTASWYGPNFHGKHTANGEVYNQYELTAAHKTLPFNTVVKVTNLDNGKSVTVRINDRGPYAGRRVIDISRAAAEQIDMIGP
ncbi:MAG TPA: septal ring lytic transglycosylase RlpA family lipoprotein, partial [Bacteroidetes bacterium]|nr:septal ring lytic transglycosylase RlpA family lipoprotein [Bacteroidota bacterium]